MTPYISKQQFLNGWICTTRGWFTLHDHDSTPPSPADRRRMMEGIEIGRLAREALGNGQMVRSLSTDEASALTKRLLQDPAVTRIYEAVFTWNGFVAKADVIVRSNGGWDLIEVKSSVRDKPELTGDLAYTYMVVTGAGLAVRTAKLMLVSRDFRRGNPATALFVEIDKTPDVQKLAASFRHTATEIEKALLSGTRPQPRPIPECADCPYFALECIGGDLKHPIFEIPRLRGKKLQKLLEAEVLEIRDIDEDFALTERQRIVREAVKSREPVISQDGLDRLDDVNWPTFYLDFETVMTALPLYDDIAPYTQLPIQYSIHVCSAPAVIEDHRYFLADPSRDDRYELLSQLRTDLDGDGSIIVYSSFEKRMLLELASAFPEFEKFCRQCVARLFDLESVIRKGIYHPEFKGSISIKRTLPTLVPEFSYDGLAVQNGDDASAHFAFMALGHYDADAIAQTRDALLEYCEKDTLAMVQLYSALLRLR